MKKKKHWPDDYQKFSGTMGDLIATANEVLRSLGHEASVTERSFRHYQHKNLVGRGIKQGKEALFGFNDLTQLIATKSLIKEGWSISQTASLLPSATQTTLSSVTTLPTSPHPTAVDVVNELMSTASLSASQAVSAPPSFPPLAYTQRAFFVSQNHLKSSTSLPEVLQKHYMISPHISVAVDSDFFEKLDKENQIKFIQALNLFAQTVSSLKEKS